MTQELETAVSSNAPASAGVSGSKFHSRRAWLLYFLPVVCLFIAFGVSLLNMPLHPTDDLEPIQKLADQSYLEALTSPWPVVPSFYRPVTSVSMKIILDLFEVGLAQYRAIEIMMIAIFLSILFFVARKFIDDPFMISIIMIYLLGSPFLFHSYTWWSDISDLIVIICFAASLLCILSETNVWTKWLVTLTAYVIAIFAKESGLIGIVFALYFLRRRHYVMAFSFILALAFYFFVRVKVLGTFAAPTAFEDTGFFLRRLSVEEISDSFPGADIYFFYLYNTGSQILSLFTRLVKHGQLRLTPLALPFLLMLVIMVPALLQELRERKQNRLLVLILFLAILGSAMIGHKYARDRIMAVASVCYAVLLMVSFARLHLTGAARARTTKALLSATYLGWAALVLVNVGKIHDEGRTYRKFYARHADFPDERVSAEIYDAARPRYDLFPVSGSAGE